ncbi:MAG TPA: hypothetical protein VKT32_13915 [Chthonomonadaceae bacterium]|nr:hypothetical protein [Chthonomonadaceae bacterium]
MYVYLPTAVVGNDHTLLSLGHSGEIMDWFYPSKDHAQHIYQCMPCVYVGPPPHGSLHWTWGGEWERHQEYRGQSNICVTMVRSGSLGLEVTFEDVVAEEGAVLIRRIAVKNLTDRAVSVGVFHYGDWNLCGIRTGNSVLFDRQAGALQQSYRDATLVVGGDALETWQCGKAGTNWANNALYDLQDGQLACSDLEIGDVNWAFGCSLSLPPQDTAERTVVFALGRNVSEARAAWEGVVARGVETARAVRQQADAAWLAPGLRALERALGRPERSLDSPSGGEDLPLPAELVTAYRRCLLGLPLLCGVEGVAVAAPEFDPEFEFCGGYGYFWPRDGAEYVSGLMDAGYPQFAAGLMDWCARHQDPAGFWQQRYFLNGAPGPNWCLPPDRLQIDQVGAVLWAYGKWIAERADSSSESRMVTENTDHTDESPHPSFPPLPEMKTRTEGHREEGAASVSSVSSSASVIQMVRRAADYLCSRLTPLGVHANAFDTWETFVGSFTYSNAALYAGLQVAARALDMPRYAEAAQRVKNGVLQNFVQNGYLTRGFDQWSHPDRTLDSSALGAIEPYGLLDLTNDAELKIAETTLRVIVERLEVDFEGGKAIRRFEGDGYVGGAPACVNTLWMARCCCQVAARLEALGRHEDAAGLTQQAQLYLATVLRRATPTGLLPELMRGPSDQRYWAAPHGWAMASFVSAVLLLAKRLAGASSPSPIAVGSVGEAIIGSR